MATKTENLAIETLHFNNFKQYIPDVDSWCKKTLESQMKLGLIQVSTAMECALAAVGGYDVISTNFMDFSDGSDSKLSTVRFRNRNKSYDAAVTGVKNKTGTLRVQVLERNTESFYYFAIPHYAYSGVKYLEIPFNGVDYTPRRNKWWDFEEPDFISMARRVY